MIGRGLYYNILRGGGRYNVKYFIDNAKISKFYDCEVVRPTRENCSKYPVVIASNIYYKEIAVQLTDFGLMELKDFIPYQALGKKIVLIHGNCHVAVIGEYLNSVCF